MKISHVHRKNFHNEAKINLTTFQKLFKLQPKIPIRTNSPKDVTHHPAIRDLLPDFCGPITEEKITRGNASNLFEFPWMALIGYITSE